MRVFFDTSIIIASLLSPTGGSTKVLQYVHLGYIIGVTSQTVIDELLEEKKYKKLQKSKTELENFVAKSGLLVRKRLSIKDVTPYFDIIVQEDAHLIAGAKKTKCSHLLTLDKKHVIRPDLQKLVSPLRIVSPKELLEEILKK